MGGWGRERGSRNVRVLFDFIGEGTTPGGGGVKETTSGLEITLT